jgi:hypothetical protein
MFENYEKLSLHAILFMKKYFDILRPQAGFEPETLDTEVKHVYHYTAGLLQGLFKS